MYSLEQYRGLMIVQDYRTHPVPNGSPVKRYQADRLDGIGDREPRSLFA